MFSNSISQPYQPQQHQTQQKALQQHNQLNSKARYSLGLNLQPRSTSRQKPSTSPIQGNVGPSSSKGTSYLAQQNSNPQHASHYQQRQFHQSASLPLAADTLSINNKSSTYSQVNSFVNCSSNHDKTIANSHSGTYMSTNSAASQNNSNEQFRLLCRKHKKPIQKICTKLGCEMQSVLCAECYFDNQQHIGMHKEHMFNFEDFIAVCKSFSLRFKDDFTFGNKPLTMLLTKLERQVMKYQLHVKREEEKIDGDFNRLIRQFTGDMEDLKERLKGQLNMHLDKVENMAKSLKLKAFDLQSEKQSNFDTANDFDDFLRNLKEIAASKAPSQNYNFKKLFQNISPLLARYKEQIQKLIIAKTSNSNNPNVVINTEQSETLSCFTGNTGASYLALNLANSPHLVPIKDLFSDFKVLSANKPYYKNKGEGQKLYGDALADIKRIYHDFSDNLSLFLESPMIKLAVDVNKEKMQALTIPEKPEINELQFIQKTDYITLKDKQTLKHIEFIKSVNTTHSLDIFSLVIIDDDTYVTGSADKTVKVFSMKDHKFLKEIKFQSDITALSTLKRPDGSIMVLVGLYGGFAVLNQGFEVFKMMEGEHDASVTCVVGLKDHETVITVSSDPKIVVWNVFNGDIFNRKYFDHKDTVYSLELFPCGKFLASGGRDRSIKVWKLRYYNEQYRNGALEKMILDTDIRDAHSADITSIKSSKFCTGILFSGSANGEIKIWELEDSTCLKTIKNTSGWIYKFIIFERPQNLETEKILEKLENTITHIAYVSPFKSKNTSLPKKSSYYSNIAGQKQATVKKTSMTSPSPLSMMVHSQNKLKSKYYLEQLKKVQFLTASFDGTLKLWNATSEIPLDSQKSKNSFDCFPFGAVTAFQKDDETRIHIFTTGNKNDTCINIWNVN